MRSARHQAEQFSVPAPKEIYNYRVYVLTLVSCMGAFIFGYDLAFIGTTLALPSFERDFNILDADESRKNAFEANVVSLLQAGCFFGSLGAGPLGDKLGRKWTVVVAGVFFFVGSCIQTWAHGSEGMMYAGRAIGGVGVGSASMLVPLYIAEISPPAIRGRLVGLYEVCVQAGTCIGFWIAYGVSSNMASNTSQWMTPFAIQLIPGGLLIVSMPFVNESPRWTARFRSREETCKLLSTIRGIPQDHPYLIEEMSNIMAQIELERNLGGGKGLRSQLKELFKKGYRNRVGLGLAITTFMEWAGSNAINYYSPRVFKSIGIDGTDTKLYATGIYGIVRLVAVAIAMLYVVDRFGRRPLLIYGSAVMAFCMWFIGAQNNLADPEHTTGISPSGYAACVMIYVYAVGFCFSWAGIPWIFCAEIFPLNIRGLCVALTTANHWLMNFAIARSTPYMLSNITYGTYFVFAACLTLAVPFVFFLVPETKGLPLEDMDALFGVDGAHFGPSGDDIDEEKGSTHVEIETVESHR